MKLFFATQNPHKVQEMQQILPGVELMIPPSFECFEDGSDFEENSLKKARALFDVVKSPVIADDSGLCIDCLDGRPGLFSSRYGSDLKYGKYLCATQQEKNLAIIREVTEALEQKGLDPMVLENRSCRFRCVITFFAGENSCHCFRGSLEGCIATKVAENAIGGFGYDPVVFLSEYGKTVAELPEGEKNRISHRGKAAALLSNFLMSQN